MCFSLCFRVGFSCSFPLRVHLFSLSLLIMFVKVVRLVWLWLLTYSESLGVRVVNVGVILSSVMCVIISPRLLFDFNCVWFSWDPCGHWLCDYSLTLDRGVIVGDSVWSMLKLVWLGIRGLVVICDLGEWVIADWVELNCYWRFLVWVGVGVWLSCDCIVMSWLIVGRGLGMGWLGVICF